MMKDLLSSSAVAQKYMYEHMLHISKCVCRNQIKWLVPCLHNTIINGMN